MAVLSDYASGTITLANGSTAATGTGTLFDVAKFREGDTLQIDNLTAVIASVDKQYLADVDCAGDRYFVDRCAF